MPRFAAALSALPFVLALMISRSASAAEPPAPKLVVAISVDQFSANLFEDWRPRFTAGLKRLSGGIVYSQAYQSHAATETCPGHSVLLTGKHPSKTGIIANSYTDPATGRMVYCVNDPSVVLAHDPKASPVGPARLMATTLGDWLKAVSPQSRVVAVSAKDRAAINMAGHKSDGTFWLAEGAGFTTYMPPGGDAQAALKPVAALNARIAKVWTTRPTWTYRNADCKAAEATWMINGKPWRSKLPPENWGVSDAQIRTNVSNSPIADELTGEAARELIKAYRLGQGTAPDLLAVSFSATDFVGHRYGTRGPEMCDELHRLDATIGKLLADIDKLHVPYLVVLSADHGGSDFPERLAAQGYPMARRVSSPEVMGRVNKALMEEFGLAKAPLTGTVEEANVVGVAEADHAKVVAAAVRDLAEQPEIAAAFTREDLLATPVRKGVPPDELSVKERFAESVYPGRSPEILAALQPELTLIPGLPGQLLSSHGTVWNYDRRVPMLFWWPGAGAQTRFLPVETVDIAPTLAAALKIAPPADVDGRCLPLSLTGAGQCGTGSKSGG